MKNWTSEIFNINEEVFKSYKASAQTWRNSVFKMEDARYGTQFSKAEEKELLAFRQAPLPISISTAICDTADALMVSAKPTVKVAPLIYPFDDEKTKNSKSVAQIYNFLVQKSWYDSMGSLQFDRAIRDYTNVGHGLLYTVPRNEYGEFSVDVKHLSWRYFFGDPDSKDPLYRDMDNMIYAMPISKKAAYRFIKSIESDMTYKNFEEDFYIANASTFSDKEDRRFAGYGKTNENTLFIQRLSLEEENVFMVIPLDDNLNKDGEISYRTYQEMTPELEKLQSQNKIRIETTKRFYLSEYTSIGALGFRKIYPVTEYNIIPFVYDHRDTPFPYSRMYYLYPLQRALNKFMMSAILNMSIMNNVKIMAEENSIINEKEWNTNASMPGVILKYRNVVPGYSTPPQVINPVPMGEAWLTMPKYLTYMMEYISGIFGTMMGDSRQAPDAFSSIASLQSAGGIKIKRRMGHVDSALSHCGNVIAQFYKEYAPINGYAIKYKEGEETETHLYNQVEVVKDETDAEGLKRKIRIKPETDLSLGFKQVRFATEGSNGYETATEALALTTLATQLRQPALIPAILKRFNLKDVDEVLSKVDENGQLTAQNSQLQGAIKEMENKTSILQNQIFQLAKSVEAQKFKGKLDKELESFKSNPEGYMEKAFNQANQQPQSQQMPLDGQMQQPTGQQII